MYYYIQWLGSNLVPIQGTANSLIVKEKAPANTALKMTSITKQHTGEIKLHMCVLRQHNVHY